MHLRAQHAGCLTRCPDSVALSLVSHTDAGKTTLACTLLGRDVGTARDATHGTGFADRFTTLEPARGEQPLL